LTPRRSTVFALVAFVAAGAVGRRLRPRRDEIATHVANGVIRAVATPRYRRQLQAVIERGLGAELADLQAQVDGIGRAPR
jgi:hypothetical protein